MKHISILSVLLFSLTISFGQVDFGVKGGLAFNAPGKIEDISKDFRSFSSAKENTIGYFIGGFAQIDLPPALFIRPELQFAQGKRSYKEGGKKVYYKQSRIELPVSVGVKVLEPLSLFAGPSFQYILSHGSKNISLKEIGKKITIGLHLGTRLQINKLGIELRYDRGLTKNEIDFLDNNKIRIGSADARPNQWAVGLSYSFQ